jgi:hypothetical protein
MTGRERITVVAAWVFFGGLGVVGVIVALDALSSTTGPIWARRVNEPPRWGQFAIGVILTLVGIAIAIDQTVDTVREARLRRWTWRCPKCGYNLRATPEQCPECGERTSEEQGRRIYRRLEREREEGSSG